MRCCKLRDQLGEDKWKRDCYFASLLPHRWWSSTTRQLTDHGMRIETVARGKSDLDLGLIYGGIGIFGFLVARYLSELTALLPPCPFHLLTGFPCPTCGVTRSSILLSRFRLLDAFLTNPLFVLLCFGVGVWALSAFVLYISGMRVRIELAAGAKPLFRILLIGSILANWAYLIVMRV